LIERVYKDGKPTEKIDIIEKHTTIERKYSCCERCSSELELCKGVYPYSVDYLICKRCDSTYILPSEKEKHGEMINAKDTSQVVKEETKRIHRKPNKPTMARIQKKL